MGIETPELYPTRGSFPGCEACPIYAPRRVWLVVLLGFGMMIGTTHHGPQQAREMPHGAIRQSCHLTLALSRRILKCT